MQKIQPGELFIYQIDSKYGVIQIIEKSKLAGYNVRIFCDLLDDITDDRLNLIVQSDNYYFIKDFYESHLTNKSNYRMINYLPNKLTMPKYMRSCERKINGKLVWFIINVNNGKVLKKFNTFNNELINLSPAETWGIEYIKTRWLENFTLDKWHIFEEKWYMNYLKEHENSNFKEFNEMLIKKICLMDEWNDKYPSEVMSVLKRAFDEFQEKLSFSNVNSIKNTILENLINTLNKINEEYSFIGTIESEKLIEYIQSILEISNISDDEDIIDKCRKW